MYLGIPNLGLASPVSGEGGPAPAGNSILLETGDELLMETGDSLLLE